MSQPTHLDEAASHARHLAESAEGRRLLRAALLLDPRELEGIAALALLLASRGEPQPRTAQGYTLTWRTLHLLLAWLLLPLTLLLTQPSEGAPPSHPRRP